MEVTLIPVNEHDVVDKLYTACRTCYNAGTPEEMWLSLGHTVDDYNKKIKLLDHVIKSGHESVIEHQQLTFMISGVSRSLTHQLVRHRLCSYSQQSQRYVEFKNGIFDFIEPNNIKDNEEASKVFHFAMAAASNYYDKLIQLGLPAEDARSVLPNACASNIVMSLNLRELRHFIGERACSCAQQEIRTLANKMLKVTVDQLPFMKKYLGPKCEMLGYCNESKERSCGRKYTKEVVFGSLEVYN